MKRTRLWEIGGLISGAVLIMFGAVAFHDAVRIGAVPHEISQAPELVGPSRLAVGEDGLEGRQVSVHV